MDIKRKLELAAKHRLGLNIQDLENVEFIENVSYKNYNAIDGTIAVFIKPIYLTDNIRLSPLYPNIGVSEDGRVFDRFTLEELPVRLPDNDKFYATVANPWRAFERLSAYKIHRAVASAWIDNPDPATNYVVNHKDGIKINNVKDNLEWTTHKGNINHAMDNGLINTKLACLVNDLKLQQITEHKSVTSAAEYLNINQTTVTYAINSDRKSPTLISNRYEVKFKSDDSPWHHTELPKFTPNNRYRIDVEYPDGRKESFWNVSEFDYKFTNRKGAKSVSDTVWSIRRLYPDHKFHLVDQKPTRVIQLLNLETNELIETTSVSTAEELTLKSEFFIRKLITQNKTGVGGNYAIREKSDTPWEIPKTNPRRRLSAKVTNLTNGITEYFTSLSTIAKETGISKPTIRRCLSVNGEFRGFKFQLLDDNH